MKNLVSFISLALFCFLSTATYSQTTFTGAVSPDWADAGNWSNGLPDPDNDTNIPAADSKEWLKTKKACDYFKVIAPTLIGAEKTRVSSRQ